MFHCWSHLAYVTAGPALQVEGIGIDEESLAYLGEIGERTSLRHAVQVRDSSCGVKPGPHLACETTTPALC